MLGQQKALSWAGFPSSPRGSPPRLPEGAGGAGHTRRQGLTTRAGATWGPTAPPQLWSEQSDMCSGEGAGTSRPTQPPPPAAFFRLTLSPLVTVWS